MSEPVSPIPEGFHSLTPHVVVKDAPAAMAFYSKAFGAKELFRMPAPDGRIMHAQMMIGDAPLMLVEEMLEYGCKSPTSLGGSAVTIHLYVEEADRVFAAAIEAGAEEIMAPNDAFWGDRFSQARDPFGHIWSIATHKRDLTPAQIEAGMKAHFKA